MGIGDSIRKQISNLINNPSKVLGDKASVIIKGINAGGGGLEEAEKLLDELKNLEKRKETLQAAEQQLTNIVNTVSATKKTAVAAKDALGPAVDGLGNFIGDTKQKLAKAIADKKKRDQLKKDREEALRN